MKKCFFLIIAAGLPLLFFSGCFELAAVGDLEAAGGIGEFGLADASVTAAEGAELGAFSIGLSEGRLTLADASSMERIEMMQAAGENPKLYVQGNPQAFAEVFPDEELARLLGEHGGEFSINEDIFAVSDDIVYVRELPSEYNGATKAIVRRGSLVTVLSEDSGWYKVNVAQGGNVITGYISAAGLIPLVAADRRRHFPCANNRPYVVIYPDATKVKNDLIGRSIHNWTFHNANEFLECKVSNQRKSGNMLSQTANLRLQDTYNRQFLATVSLTYWLQGTHWMMTGISQSGFSIASDADSYVPSPPVQTYNLGYVLTNHLTFGGVNRGYDNRNNGRNYSNTNRSSDLRNNSTRLGQQYPPKNNTYRSNGPQTYNRNNPARFSRPTTYQSNTHPYNAAATNTQRNGAYNSNRQPANRGNALRSPYQNQYSAPRQQVRQYTRPTYNTPNQRQFNTPRPVYQQRSGNGQRYRPR